MSTDKILDDYAEHADAIAPMFETLSTPDVLAPVASFLPSHPSDIADIGAGTGRDAAWFASLGHRVVAVEPVKKLAEYGQDHHSDAIEWVDDTLPDLHKLTAANRRFDLILVGSVWHHLDSAASETSLSPLAALLKPAGRLIISLKEFADEQTAAATLSANELRGHVQLAGLDIALETRSDAHQTHNRLAGNTWVWFVIEPK